MHSVVAIVVVAHANVLSLVVSCYQRKSRDLCICSMFYTVLACLHLVATKLENDFHFSAVAVVVVDVVVVSIKRH